MNPELLSEEAGRTFAAAPWLESESKTMKTAKEWMTELSNAGEGHASDCVCDRCKNGKETFLLERDIVKIQLHALHWAASQIITDGNPDVAREKIMREIQRVAEPSNVRINRAA